MPNNVWTTVHLFSFHILARFCSEFFKLGFSSMWSEDFHVYKLDLEKAEEPDLKLPTFVRSQRNEENSEKTSTSDSLTLLKSLTVWTVTSCRKFFKRWEYQTTIPAFWETCIQIKKQQLELDMEQKSDSKLGKEYIKAVYCYSACFTYMQSISWEMPRWMKLKLEWRLLGQYQ